MFCFFFFWGEKKRKVLVARILNTKDLKRAASGAVPSFPVHSSALAMAAARGWALPQQASLQPSELALGLPPSTLQKAPWVLTYLAEVSVL